MFEELLLAAIEIKGCKQHQSTADKTEFVSNLPMLV